MDSRLFFEIEKDDVILREDLETYFGDDITVTEVHNLGDIISLISLGISVAALTLQAIEFISTRIQKKEDKVYSRCIIDPNGRIDLTTANYSPNETKDIIISVIEAKKREKQ